MIKKRIQNYFGMLQSEIAKQNEEIIWANVWHDTCGGYPGLKMQTFHYPREDGRWVIITFM